MNEYQKTILKAQEDFSKRESDRYFSQKDRIESYSWFRRLILGQAYENLLKDCEETHKFNLENILKLSQLLMEKTFGSDKKVSMEK
ncbi:MAG: hypothetical protein AABY22_00405 [Nanoarchaeota archaeon]